MGGAADRDAADEPRERLIGSNDGPPGGGRPWAVLLGGTALALVLSLAARELEGVLAQAAAKAGMDLPWWHGMLSPAALATALGATALVAALLRHNRQTNHRDLHVLSGLALPEKASQSAWRLLLEGHVIDGHALWDGADRLIDHAGFLGSYLPQLAEWQHPSGRQVVTALVDSGQLCLLPGAGRDQTIEIICSLRSQIPGLREFRMADGQVFLARTLTVGKNGRATIFSNITEFKRQQQARRVHEDAFHDAFESYPAMLALLDADRRPLAVNRTFRTILGRSLDQMTELGWAGISHPDDHALAWSAGTRRFLAADGSLVRGQVRISPVHDGDGRVLVTVEDVTARWDADERMRLQATLLEQIGSAVLAVDRQGRVVYGNPAAQALFQWSDTILPGTPIERLLGAEARDLLETERTEMEIEGATWSGLHFPAQVGIARLQDTAGQPAGAVLVVTDLTPRRALDLQLMHSARLATLGEMAASIAHEFNQCLHVIRLASEALRLDLGDGALDPGRVAKRTDNILNQVDRLTEMVTHMRSISRRDDSGKRPFRPQGALDAALRMVEPLLHGDGIALVRQSRLGHRIALGHQVRLEQVLLNLLNNARDSIRERFRRDGDSGGCITVLCHAENGRLRITVRDDGIGVPEQVGRHIFEPFFTTKDDGRGCGLGLSISRGICSEMGGSLTFRTLEAGAEFTIELPEAEAAENEPPTPAPVRAHWGDDEDEDLDEEHRVLLADDEALSVMMVSEFLERQGYAVDVAYDGLEALEKCQTHVYHAVITDIRMPRMDGHALIARLDELQPGTPVIVVTGHLRESNAAALGGNVVALLSKPFQLQDLRDHLHRSDYAAQRQRQIQEEGV